MGHKLQFYQDAASSVFKVKKMHDAVQKQSNNEEGESVEASEAQVAAQEEEQRQAIESALEEALPTFLQTAWSCVVTDIDGTVKEVSRKLLKDKSACWQIRLRRAQALQKLGEIFQEEGTKAEQAQGSSTAKLMSSD